MTVNGCLAETTRPTFVLRRLFRKGFWGWSTAVATVRLRTTRFATAFATPFVAVAFATVLAARLVAVARGAAVVVDAAFVTRLRTGFSAASEDAAAFLVALVVSAIRRSLL